MKVFLLFLAVAGACRVADDCVLCSRDCYYLIFEGGGGICSPNLDVGGDFIGVIPQGSSIMCPNFPPTDSTSKIPAPPKKPITKPVTPVISGGSSTKDYNAIVWEENGKIFGKTLPDSNLLDYTAIIWEKNEAIIGEMPITTTIPFPKYREVSSSSSPSSASASSSGWIVAGAIASVVFIFVLLLIGFKVRKVVGRAYHHHHDELRPSDLV